MRPTVLVRILFVIFWLALLVSARAADCFSSESVCGSTFPGQTCHQYHECSEYGGPGECGWAPENYDLSNICEPSPSPTATPICDCPVLTEIRDSVSLGTAALWYLAGIVVVGFLFLHRIRP